MADGVGIFIDWHGDGDFTDLGDDVSARMKSKTAVGIEYGRDQARSLSPVAPGSAQFELNNVSRDYSPENTSSPLAGNILPARPVKITKTVSGVTYTLFRGHLDDYKVLPDLETQSVQLTATDLLEKFKAVTISIDLVAGIRTGQAVNLILDAMGWPAADRDIDAGATTIRWYWEEQTDGLTALQRIVSSEGPAAFVTVGANGELVFRDRHHRLTRAASLTSQATLRDATGPEPRLSPPLEYDHGWKDIVNDVTILVNERTPASELSAVFTSDEVLSIADGETVIVRAGASDPFYAAVTPELDTDYTLQSGVVTVTMSRTSGQSTSLFIKAVGGPAIVDHMQVRAYPVKVVRTIQVHAEDPVSIGTTAAPRYGRRSWPGEAPWVGVHDAKAICDLILAQRAERLPIVRARIVNANPLRAAQQLTRNLSDRITLSDTGSGLSGAFFIERIEHHIDENGQHETVFGCEKVPSAITGVFRFDVAGAGFNDGKFGSVGVDDPATMFRFDTAGQGFNDGMFAH